MSPGTAGGSGVAGAAPPARPDVTVVVGVGVASAATPEEVAGLVAAALAEAGRRPADVAAVATVTTRRHHPAIVALGLPVVAFTPAELAAEASGAALPPAARAGMTAAARPAVAEPAALLAARRPARRPAGAAAAGPVDADGGADGGGDVTLVVPKRRSGRATVAVAVGRRR